MAWGTAQGMQCVLVRKEFQKSKKLVWPSERYLIFLGFRFFIGKMGIFTTPTLSRFRISEAMHIKNYSPINTLGLLNWPRHYFGPDKWGILDDVRESSSWDQALQSW